MATSDQPRGPAEPEVDERQVDAALHAITQRSLKTATAGLAVLFALLAVAHPFVLPEGARSPMSLLAAATAAARGPLCYGLRRWRLAPRHAQPVGAGIVLLVLANCLLHVYLTAELRHTTALLLLLVGAGSLFVSSSWFALVVGGTLVGWTVIVWRLVALVPALAISGEVMRFAVGLASATVIGGAIHVLRVRTLRELERLSIKNALHARALEETLGAAGMDDYLSKPVKLEKLREVLAHWAGVPAAPSTPGAAVEATGEAVDLGALEELRSYQLEGDTDTLERLIAKFLDSARDECAEARAALSRGDPETLRRAVHGLKSSSSMFGARRLSALSARIEELSKRRTLGEAVPLVDELEQELQRVARILEAERQARPAP